MTPCGNRQALAGPRPPFANAFTMLLFVDTATVASALVCQQSWKNSPEESKTMVRRPLRRKSLKQHLGFERLPLQSEAPLRVQCGLLRVPSCSVSMSLCFSPLPLTPSNSFRRYFRSILPCCCCPRTSVPIRPKDGFGIPTRLNPGTIRVSKPFLPCSWIPRIPGSPRNSRARVLRDNRGQQALLQTVGFFPACSGGLFLGRCFLPSSFLLDFLQPEIVLEGIHPCNVHELLNDKFRLGNLSRLCRWTCIKLTEGFQCGKLVLGIYQSEF